MAGTASSRKPSRSMIRAPSAGDRDLADVVEERRVAQEVELGLRELELAADCQRQLLHTPRVPRRRRVPGVDRRRERLHRGRGPFLQQAIRLFE